MAVTKLVDMDEERLLRHFCLDSEIEQVMSWCGEASHSRPEEFDERLKLAEELKRVGNAKYRGQDFHASMMAALGALHCIDFSQAKVLMQTDAQKHSVDEMLVLIMSNLSMVFLKRNDAYNAGRAADLGLTTAKKLTGGKDSEQIQKLRAKLLFRRGISKGQTRDFSDALGDLKEAAKLLPSDHDIRKAYENCKIAIQRERGAPDDRWRGLLTDTPATAKLQAKTSRFRRDVRQGIQEFWQEAQKTDNLKMCSALLLALVFSSWMPRLARAWFGKPFMVQDSVPS